MISQNAPWYHIYNAIWEVQIDKELACLHKTDNELDCNAVSVNKSATVFGHFLRKISTLSLCSTMRSICRINSHQRFTLKGGMGVPCDIQFEGCKEELEKMQNLLDSIWQDGFSSNQSNYRRSCSSSCTMQALLSNTDSRQRPRLANEIKTWKMRSTLISGCNWSMQFGATITFSMLLLSR